jgi:Domain of unknown function (DUF6429)
MPLNTDKIDDTALALLYLTLHDGSRAWKGMDWGVLGRLHDKGMIDNPVGKVKSARRRGCNVRRRCSRRCLKNKSDGVGRVRRKP